VADPRSGSTLVLPGDRVTLVAVPAAEVDGVLAGAVAPWVPGPGWPTPETAFALGYVAVGGETFLVVDEAGRVVGEAGTKGPAAPGAAVEIGYGLSPAVRGRGLGTRAVAVLVEHLLAQAVGTVVATVAPSNLPSRRLLARLGFAEAGTDGELLRYALHRPGCH
jgi:RimJ/RimL family protein N-acetyltransferase